MYVIFNKMPAKRIITQTLVLLSLFLLICPWSCKRKPSVNPVAIIGMDGLDWRIVRQMMGNGELKNIKKVIDSGVSAEMQTLEPMLSPAIWTTMATGVLPETHGITWFMVKDAAGNMIPVTSAQRRVKAIWNIVSEENRTIDLVGWWGTWPAERVRGRIISDHMGFHIFTIQSDKVETEVGNTYPEKLSAEISSMKIDPFKIPLSEIKRFMQITDMEYSVSVDMKALCQRPEYKECLYCKGESKIPFCHFNPLHHFLRALATLETFEAMSLHLIKNKQPDLFMVYFEWVDTVSHQYLKFAPPRMDWVSDEQYSKYHDVIRQTYIRQDEALGKFMAALSPNTNIMIMSDHGFKIGDERLSEAKVTAVANAHLWHHSPAFFAMCGPDIRKGGKKINARVQDITPTALALMALPVPEYMIGKVLADGIEPSFFQKYPIRRIKVEMLEKKKDDQVAASGQASGSNIDPQIKEHLKALGYIGDVDETGLDMNRVSLLLGKGRFDEAAETLEGVIKKDPSNLKAIGMLGELYLQMGRFDQAADACSKINNVSLTNLTPQGRPIVGSTFANWGLALLNMENLDGAWEKCSQALKIAPRVFQGHFCLGRVAEKQNRIDEAIKYYNEAAGLNPKSAEVYNNLGNCYIQKGKLNEAIEYYHQAARINPAHIECHHNAGVAYLKMGNIEEAESEFRKAIAIDPAFVPSISELGNLLSKQNRYEEAAEIFKNWAARQPMNFLPLLNAARAEMAAGSREAALDMLRKAHSLNPEEVNKQISSDPLLSQLAPDLSR